jgi:hypothetical protein
LGPKSLRFVSAAVEFPRALARVADILERCWYLYSEKSFPRSFSALKIIGLDAT